MVEQLSPRIRRITAPNPGAMTGAGTNCYLLGQTEIAVIDPGPAIPAHIDTILAAAGSNIRWIVVTHTHPDHSPAAAVLARESGAELVGCVHADDGHQDITFQVKSNISDGQLLCSGDDFSLEAVATPGHVGNHFCYWMPQEHAMFTGDHIISGSTVVIIPPSGDMADYLQSLARLKDFPMGAIYPGHGAVITSPLAEVERVLLHRLRREAKVVSILEGLGQSSLKQLTPLVYDDVDQSLHLIAQVSLWAHLLKLEKEGLVRKFSKDHWMFGEERWEYLGG